MSMTPTEIKLLMDELRTISKCLRKQAPSSESSKLAVLDILGGDSWSVPPNAQSVRLEVTNAGIPLPVLTDSTGTDTTLTDGTVIEWANVGGSALDTGISVAIASGAASVRITYTYI